MLHFTKITLALFTLMMASQLHAKEANTTLQTPLITYPSSKDATGDVKAVFAEIKAAYGIVPEPLKSLSLNPKILRNTWESYKIMGMNKNFSPKLGAMMRMLIAEKQKCTFCIGFNKAMLLNVFKLSESEITTLQKDPSTAKLEKKEKAMLLFMLKSTSTPHDINKADMDALKKLGWTETDIMEGVNQATHMVAVSLYIDTFKIQ